MFSLDLKRKKGNMILTERTQWMAAHSTRKLRRSSEWCSSVFWTNLKHILQRVTSLINKYFNDMMKDILLILE